MTQVEFCREVSWFVFEHWIYANSCLRRNSFEFFLPELSSGFFWAIIDPMWVCLHNTAGRRTSKAEVMQGICTCWRHTNFLFGSKSKYEVQKENLVGAIMRLKARHRLTILSNSGAVAWNDPFYLQYTSLRGENNLVAGSWPGVSTNTGVFCFTLTWQWECKLVRALYRLLSAVTFSGIGSKLKSGMRKSSDVWSWSD